MKIFRLRFAGALLFALLSLGQAYPFSAAWAAQGKAHACCCLKGEEGMPCRCRHGGKMKCHHETTPGYSAAPCGAPADVHSLNFSGEPCLPRFAMLAITLEDRGLNKTPRFTLPKFQSVPEPPPPKRAAL